MDSNDQTHTRGQAQDTIGSEYLTFTLGSEEYAIDILRVQEIRAYEAVTRIANLPDFIKGVIDLRGVIVPIVDLRIKFGLPAEYSPLTVVIILNIHNRVIGIVVDGVSDVALFKEHEIKPAPDFSAKFDTRYILGLASLDKRMIIVTDISKLLSGQEMALLEPLVA
ncbi:MAG: chemotaxis signal transduction protein [Proteobacteria bacterium]|nr:chemotaxis signal transduction protein [Pseudomonadota bacterium]